MNHGIYIDIFPIDNSKIRNTKIDLLAEKILNLRISSSLYTKHKTLKSQIFKIASCIFYPSLRRAIKKRDNLSKSASESGYVCITGGKSSERKIPAEWFTSAVADVFEGVSVYVPDGYDKYLRCIYGEYEKRTLVEGKMLGDSVELNACIVDTQKPYTEYVINNK
jgi:phosphorylcholine metabolism protein LicD